MTSSNSSSLSRAWLRANCCRCADTRQDTANNNFKDAETPLREETETLLHRIAFTVWHTALHIESEVCANSTRASTRVRDVCINLHNVVYRKHHLRIFFIVSELTYFNGNLTVRYLCIEYCFIRKY